MNELALFAGAGGGLLGSILNGWRTVCAVEIDEYCRNVLLQRQRDGMLNVFPIWDDVQTFDGRPWRGCVDIVTGGFPCQDISAAGKGVGIEGERSGLWREFARILGEVRPRFAFVENSPRLTSRGLGRVLGDLAEMGFNARWGCVSAEDAIWLGGTPSVYHERERIWIVATHADAELRGLPIRRRVADFSEAQYAARTIRGNDTSSVSIEKRQGIESGDANSLRQQQPEGIIGDIGGRAGDSDLRSGEVGHADGSRLEKRQGIARDDGAQRESAFGTSWWLAEPDVGGMVDGLARELDDPE